MSTVSAMAKNTTTMYQIAAKAANENTSSSSSSESKGANSDAFQQFVNSQTPSSSASGASSLWSGSSSMWSNYTGSSNAASAGSDYISSVLSSRTTLSGILSDYDAAKKTFTTEFGSAMKDLGQAADAMRKMNFNVAGADDEETEANTKAAIGTIQNFVTKYNEAVSFLKDNKEVSNRTAALANSFADTSYFAKTLGSVGITTSSSGELKIDEAQLSKALKERPGSVEYVLGKNGLAGRTEQKVSMAQMQKDKLFPSVSSMLGNSVAETKRMYSANTLARTSMYSNVGTLLNLWF